jgi:hypothetical protein
VLVAAAGGLGAARRPGDVGKLGFAVLLAFWRRHGRFLDNYPNRDFFESMRDRHQRAVVCKHAIGTGRLST